MACNLYGLMHSEFDAQKGLVSDRPFTQPPEKLALLADIARHADEAVSQALDVLCCNPSPNWGVDRMIQDRLGRVI